MWGPRDGFRLIAIRVKPVGSHNGDIRAHHAVRIALEHEPGVEADDAQGMLVHEGPDHEIDVLIRRQLPMTVTDDDLGGLILRAATCVSYEPGLSCVRSFWGDERKESHCVYWATDPAQITTHARYSRIPCDEITEVGENHPSLWAQVYDDFGLPRHWESSDATAHTFPSRLGPPPVLPGGYRRPGAGTHTTAPLKVAPGPLATIECAGADSHRRRTFTWRSSASISAAPCRSTS